MLAKKIENFSEIDLTTEKIMLRKNRIDLDQKKPKNKRKKLKIYQKKLENRLKSRKIGVYYLSKGRKEPKTKKKGSEK